MNRLLKLANYPIVLHCQLQLKKDQWKDSRQLKKIQFKRLRALITYAYNCVPYYRRLFLSVKIKPEDIRNSDDLRKIPVTSKQDVQKNYQDFIARGLNISKLPSHFTSGSTGTPVRVICDNHSTSFNYGVTRYSFSERGVKLSDNFVTIWGRAVSIVRPGGYVRLLGNVRETIIPFFPAEKLINVLRQMTPDIINTFPTVFSSLASYDVSGINPRLIFTQGEVVTKRCRDLVRDMFDLELLDSYGSVEFGHMAFECDEHCGLHAITHGVYIEFVDEDGEHASSGEPGEIVITGLYNHAMPLIRYRIGDVGTPSDERCPCGRSWPLIKSIQGRINDFLVMPSGRIITILHFYDHLERELEKNVFSISQCQLIQEAKDRIIFKVVKGKKFDPEMLVRIKNNLETYFAKLGEKVEVEPQVVKEISTARTGKRRVLISTINESLRK